MEKKSFILELPLYPELWQMDVLNTRFEIARQMYNSLLGIQERKYKELIKNKKYRYLMKSLNTAKEEDKSAIWKEIRATIQDCGFSEYAFQADVKTMQFHFKCHIDSNTAQKIATRAWKAYAKFFYGNGKTVHYKKYGDFNSVEGKKNETGIRFIDNHILWNKLNIPVFINKKNMYETEALSNKVKYCRIIRRLVRGKYKYYVQLILNGTAPVKYTKDGEFKHKMGKGSTGIDPGISTMAAVAKDKAKVFELADKTPNFERQIQLLLRKMDRSRRATNSNNYNEDGTIKKQGSKKVVWIRSNNYMKTLFKLKELYRKQAAVRKLQHEILANEILSYGDTIYVEEMNYAGLQKRAKETKKNESTGRFQKKKRFGKSIGNRAPSMFLNILKRKANARGGAYIEINTKKAKASQFNHFTGEYKKKELNERWNVFGDIKIQRDLYSAFLIMNINSDLETFNIAKCNATFENFLRNHDKEILEHQKLGNSHMRKLNLK